MIDFYGVIGNPIQHSLSPKIHRMFAAQTNQNLVYDSILVELNALPQMLTDFQAKGGKGLNVTLPFKQEVFALVDACSERAQNAGAVNTIRFNPDGSRFGDNTDGIGFIRDLIFNYQFAIKKKRILLLGAGGAARGVLIPILNEWPEELVIANRTVSKAIDLAEAFDQYGPVCGSSLEDLAGTSFDLVINATSASLQTEKLNLPKNILRASACCYDMVYGKGMTPFLHWAREQGAALIIDGLGMLVEQAAEAFFLWREVRPETSQVLAKLSAAHKMNSLA